MILDDQSPLDSCTCNIPEFSPEETLKYIEYLKRNAHIRPRTFWVNVPFFIVTENHRQKFCFGYRPEDLAHIDRINKKALAKHKAYLERLTRFPLDKAEYYLRLKETQGISSVRELATTIGEDWSHIYKTLSILELPQPIKDFLVKNKKNPAMVKFFNLKKLLEVVREKEERLQLYRFRQFIEEFEMMSMENILYANKI